MLEKYAPPEIIDLKFDDTPDGLPEASPKPGKITGKVGIGPLEGEGSIEEGADKPEMTVKISISIKEWFDNFLRWFAGLGPKPEPMPTKPSPPE